MNSTKDLRQILTFLRGAEKLKTVLRHGWLSSGRRENVAEHTWRMGLMAVLCKPYIKQKVNLERVLKMTLVHDLAEIYATDYPAHKKPLANKSALEKKALERILKSLPAAFKKEFMDLWMEYEANKTPEAGFAKALDKIEAIMQHNEGGVKKLIKAELRYNLAHGYKHAAWDPFLLAMRDEVKKETLRIYKKNKINRQLYA